MKIKQLLSMGLLVLGVVCLTACTGGSQTGLERITTKGKLVVATSPDYAPFEFQTLVDGKNKVVGADIELAQAIADDLGVELEISTMSFDNVLSSLQTGKADLAISGLAVTDERKEVFDFSDSYYDTKNSLLIRSSDIDKFTSLADFTDKKVAAQKASIPEELVKEQMEQSNLVSLTDMGEAIMELKSGKVDAVSMDDVVALGYVAQNTDLAIAKVSLTEKVGDSNAVAMVKGNDELKKAVNKVIEKLKQNQAYQTFLENASKLTVVE